MERLSVPGPLERPVAVVEPVEMAADTSVGSDFTASHLSQESNDSIESWSAFDK